MSDYFLTQRILSAGKGADDIIKHQDETIKTLTEDLHESRLKAGELAKDWYNGVQENKELKEQLAQRDEKIKQLQRYQKKYIDLVRKYKTIRKEVAGANRGAKINMKMAQLCVKERNQRDEKIRVLVDGFREIVDNKHCHTHIAGVANRSLREAGIE